MFGRATIRLGIGPHSSWQLKRLVTLLTYRRYTNNCICLSISSLAHMQLGKTFGRPFVQRFALCYQTVVLSVCDIGVLWPNGWMDQDETWHGLGPSHIVLDGDPAPPQNGHSSTPNFRPVSVVATWSPISASAELVYIPYFLE